MAWDDPLFLPFDWGYFAFVHDTTKTGDPRQPTSVRWVPAMFRFIIQDPRSSTPGLGLANVGEGGIRR